jgi:hypothetical protein
MKRPNITPGSWNLGEEDPLLVDTETWYIASAHAFVGEGSSRDNARAIAAVPDLLTALAAIRDASDDLRLTPVELRTAAGHLASHALLKAGYTF